MASRLEMATKLVGSGSRASDGNTKRPRTSTVTAEAMSDSADGTVLVDLGGDVVSGTNSQYVEVPTTADVREGDTVLVTLSGADGTAKAATATGAIGGGDRAREEVRTVSDIANATSQHFWADADGAHVSSTGDHDTSGFHQLMTSVKDAFMHGNTELMTISESLIELGKNSASSIIKMCGGNVTVSAVPDAMGRYTGILSGSNVAKMRSLVGNASVGVDGFQDLISMVAGYLLVDDGTDALTQVSMRRFLTAIQPVVLYNGGAALDYDAAPGAGTTGTVTLSDDASHFKEITIFYHYGTATSSVTLHSPNEWQAGLYLMFVGADGNLWTKTRSAAIRGTSITNASNAANLATRLTDGACLFAQSRPTPEIIIDRVEGRR